MLVKRVRAVLGILLFVGSPQTSHAFSQTSLTSPQQQALRRVDEAHGDYAITVYAGEVAGRPRTVVFLGEKHIKNKADAKLGEELLDQFRTYGLEGAETGKYWGGKVFLVSVLTGFLLYKLFSFGAITEGSTIDTARGKASTRELVEQLKLWIYEHKLEQMTPEELDKVIVRVNKKSFTGANIFRYLHELEEKALTEPVVIPLENNHQPGRGENIISVVYPMIVFGSLTGVGAFIYVVGRFIARGKPLHALALGSSFAIPFAVGLKVGGRRAKPTAEELSENPMLLPLLTERNETMAANIFKAYEQLPELDQMLVVVGQAHVPGMGQQLEKLGFSRVSLEELEKAAPPSQAQAF